MSVFLPKPDVGADEMAKQIFLRRAMLEKEKRAKKDTKSYREWLVDAAPQYNWDFPHSNYIARYLERLTNREFRNLMIFMPPRHGKSLTTTVNYPAYRFEVNPKDNILVASYNQDLAETFSKQTRQLVREREIVGLDKERQKIDHWLTKAGGNYRGAGIGGGITGRGYELMIIDDPIRGREEANSVSFRDKQWQWYNDDFKTRRSKLAQQIVILTRWHEDDLAGRLLEKNPIGTEFEWVIVRIPAICEGDDPKDYPHREIGEALCPDLMPLAMLEDQREGNPDSFLSMYQQRPSAKEGDIFKRDWFEKNKAVAKFPDRAKKITQVWDTALEAKQRNDPSAMVEGWRCPDTGLIYVAAMVNKKMEFPELIREMRQQRERQGDSTDTCVEDKASGKPARQQLRTEGIPIIEVPTGTIDKEVRARSITNYCESGMIVFVNLVGNINAELFAQLTTFPNGRHDDLVDAFVHLLRRLTSRAQGWDKEDLAKIVQSYAGSNSAKDYN